jgi:Phenol hydroxylase, C-terminal dimerisation domain
MTVPVSAYPECSRRVGSLHTFFTNSTVPACQQSELPVSAALRPSRRDRSRRRSQPISRRRGPRPHYSPSILTSDPTYQRLAEGLTVGMRFHSAPVIRVADAKPLHLGHAVKARFEVDVFKGAPLGGPPPRLSPLRRHGGTRPSGLIGIGPAASLIRPLNSEGASTVCEDIFPTDRDACRHH